jgi:hypothetical protein
MRPSLPDSDALHWRISPSRGSLERAACEFECRIPVGRAFPQLFKMVFPAVGFASLWLLILNLNPGIKESVDAKWLWVNQIWFLK